MTERSRHMKNLFFGKIVAIFRYRFMNKNYEWNLSKSHKSFDTINLDLRRDMSVVQH